MLASQQSSSQQSSSWTCSTYEGREPPTRPTSTLSKCGSRLAHRPWQQKSTQVRTEHAEHTRRGCREYIVQRLALHVSACQPLMPATAVTSRLPPSAHPRASPSPSPSRRRRRPAAAAAAAPAAAAAVAPPTTQSDPSLRALFADERIRGLIVLLRNLQPHEVRQVFEEEYGDDAFVQGAKETIFRLMDKYR
jgi:hypothetical protein